MIKDQKIKEFLEQLASKSPTPGGGAVAALTAAMAAALVEMVCNLTKEDKAKGISGESGKLRIRLLELADEDVEAFDQVMKAYKSKSRSEIKKALEGAIAVPEQTKELATRVEELAKIVEKEGNKNAVSDARSAVYLAQAAQKSAQENIDINRKLLSKVNS